MNKSWINKQNNARAGSQRAVSATLGDASIIYQMKGHSELFPVLNSNDDPLVVSKRKPKGIKVGFVQCHVRPFGTIQHIDG